jgi:hypothetical protein
VVCAQPIASSSPVAAPRSHATNTLRRNAASSTQQTGERVEPGVAIGVAKTTP